jgi:heat shock protein HslJ
VTSAAIAGREWVLVSIGSENVTIPKPPTLRLDAAAVRASGHGGCNRYSASYTLNGDSLTFGPAMATKMFCNEGSAIEQKFFDALTTTTRFELTDSSLVLRTSRGDALTFRPAT